MFLFPYFNLWEILQLCRIITSAKCKVANSLLFPQIHIYSTGNSKTDEYFNKWIVSGLKYHTSNYNTLLY